MNILFGSYCEVARCIVAREKPPRKLVGMEANYGDHWGE